MNSRAKGARGERAGAAAWAAIMGGTARRGQQFSGGQDSPDIVSSHKDIHLECKRVEAGNPYRWMEQAVRDAGPKVPCVLHKRNREDWLLIVRLADVPRFILAAQDIDTPDEVGEDEIPPSDAGQGVPAAGEEGRVLRVCGVRRGKQPCRNRCGAHKRQDGAGQHVCGRVGAPENDSPGGQQ